MDLDSFVGSVAASLAAGRSVDASVLTPASLTSTSAPALRSCVSTRRPTHWSVTSARCRTSHLSMGTSGPVATLCTLGEHDTPTVWVCGLLEVVALAVSR